MEQEQKTGLLEQYVDTLTKVPELSDKLSYLPNVVLLLAAAVFIVALFKRLHLSPVLGYLVAGAAIGNYGFNYIRYEEVESFAKFGIVFLLFIIGIELTLERLVSMRTHVFGFGSLQVIITSIVIAAIAYYTVDIPLEAAIVIGGALALSSTALVLKVVESAGEQSSQVGRLSLAVLLLQDLAVVPLLVLVPLLSGDHGHIAVEVGGALFRALIAMLIIFFAGRLVLRPLFKMIASTKSDELFIATVLFIVLGTSLATEYLQLSLALGAFIAGLLVAETQYNNQVLDSIRPFKSLLLGLFFMSVGMSIDVGLIIDKLPWVLLLSVSLIIGKAIIIIGLCKLFRFNLSVSVNAGLLLAQGGEFAFILFGLAADQSVLPAPLAQLLLVVVTVTMALTPLLSILGTRIAAKIASSNDIEATRCGDQVSDLDKHIIVCGYGRVGKMVSRMLSHNMMRYVVLDVNASRVQEGKDEGIPAFRGDASRTEILEQMGISRALAVIVTVDNNVTIRRMLKTIRDSDPYIPVIVRTRDYKDAKRFAQEGATIIVPETYETGLQLGGALFKSIGFSEFAISKIKNQFRAGEYAKAADIEMVEEEVR